MTESKNTPEATPSTDPTGATPPTSEGTGAAGTPPPPASTDAASARSKPLPRLGSDAGLRARVIRR